MWTFSMDRWSKREQQCGTTSQKDGWIGRNKQKYARKDYANGNEDWRRIAKEKKLCSLLCCVENCSH